MNIVSTSSFNFSAAMWALLIIYYEEKGNKYINTIGYIIMLIGLGLFSTYINILCMIGYILLGIGGAGIMISSFSIPSQYPNILPLCFSLINAAVDASCGLFYITRLL